jgi:hypothetical protein
MDSPFAKLKVTELREQLQAKGLPTKGLKKDLIERLEAAILPTSDSQNELQEGDAVNDEGTIEDDTVQLNSHEIQSAGEDIKNVEIEKAEDELVAEHKVQDAEEQVHNGHLRETDVSMQGDLQISEAIANHQESVNTSPITLTDYPKDVSSVLKIGNFTRPFSLASVNELLSSFGTVITFWMDSLRTHAFVEYDTLLAAAQCKGRLDGIQWPERTGRNLSVQFSSADFMNAAMNAPMTGRRSPVTDDALDGESLGKRESSKTLDDLFRKTRARPHIYYLPARVD